MRLLNFLITVTVLMNSSTSYNLDLIRANYDKVFLDRELCKKMIVELDREKNNSATYLGYLGGLQTILANHVFSPISKWNTFKKGKGNIEKAIKIEPNNVELRFIRLSIQKNIPSFLGYKSNIDEDIEFIKKNRNQICIEILNNNIEMLLKK